ncbi:MAG: flagellar basal-body MS-ring/collar protein FliF [Gammaproteobacteria bacterium]|nr:flagellar basal-body MS-ring/collar protein FliF [Gammaproteobacteria bacterium]
MALVKAEEVSAGFTGLSGLHAFRQIGIMLGLAASVALGVTIVLWSWAPSFGVLYGALEEQDVSTVLDALQQNGFEAKLDQATGAILVPTSSIHDARIKLASMGLPKGVSAGFDALDEKNNFGVSQFMEKARYQRALEIELARTISSLSNVKNARVHLAVPQQSVFVRNRKNASASVVVNLFPGRNLDEGQVSSIMHMVSSSVADMNISNVTIVDQRGNLLSRGESTQKMAKTGAQFEYASRLENSYIDRIERLLTPILGSESVRAQVTADIDFTMSEQTQESFNPDTPALRSNQTLVEQSSGGSMNGGIPGALSNQPPGAATAPELVNGGVEGGVNGGANGSSNSHRKEIKNYELDKTISHTRFSMGRLRRLSVAVVVDDSLITAADGSLTRTQRTPEELDRLSNLVKEAVGFNAQRGDTLNIMNSSFTMPVTPEELPEVPLWEQGWAQDVAKKSLGALLVMLLLFGVLKPILRQLATQSKMMPVAAFGNNERAMSDDTLTLGAKPENLAIKAPGSYEQNLLTANAAVEQDPKLVAQVVKNWVASDG